MLSRKLVVAGIAIVWAGLGIFAGLSRGADDLWLTDFAAAKAKAKTEHKLLLVDFTGSDWCIWCKKLKAEILDKDAFTTAAPKQFVLVELDFPAQKEQPPELKQQNKELQEHYNIHGFPTLLLLDPEGKVVAQTGYKAVAAEEYVKQLAGLVKTYEGLVAMLSEVEKVKGLDRAKELDKIVAAYETLGTGEEDVRKYGAEIVSLDPENKTGLKLKYTFRGMLADAHKQMAEGKFSDAKATLEAAAALPGLGAEQQQDAYFAEGECRFNLEDFTGLITCLQKANDAAPQSPKAADLEAMIQRFQPLADAQAAVGKLTAAAAKAEGLDRAKLLDQLVDAETKLGQVRPNAKQAEEVAKLTKEIISLDPDNKAGLKTKYRLHELVGEAVAARRANDLKKAQAALDEALALPGLTDEQKANVDRIKKLLEKQ